MDKKSHQYLKSEPFKVILLLQTIFITIFHGELNLLFGIPSLIVLGLFLHRQDARLVLANTLLNVLVYLMALKFETISNSAGLFFFINISILLFYFNIIKLRGFKLITTSLIAIAYILSAFHKMNKDFLFSKGNCANFYLNAFLDKLDILPISSISILPITIILIELCFGLLLFLSQKRNVLFICVGIFHLLATIANPLVEGFSALIIISIVIIHWDFQSEKKNISFTQISTLALLVIFLNLPLHYFDIFSGDYNRLPGLFFLGLIILGYKSIKDLPLTNFDFQVNGKILTIQISYIIFCLLPYTGIREIGSMNMYSNLIPVSQNSNHYFLHKIIPKMINPWEYRIKIYEITNIKSQTEKVDKVFVPNQIRKYFKEKPISIRAKIYGEHYNGNLEGAYKLIDKKNTFIGNILSRLIIPHPQENLEDKMHTCLW